MSHGEPISQQTLIAMEAVHKMEKYDQKKRIEAKKMPEQPKPDHLLFLKGNPHHQVLR